MTQQPLTESLSRRPLPDLIAERITTSIANGSLRPGDRLPSEPELAGQLEVGRSSLREALRKLHTQGVLEVVRGRGTFVCEPPADDPTLRFVQWSATHGYEVAELLEVRIGLEATAAGLACIRATDDELARLTERCADHEVAHEKQDLEQLVRTDAELHRSLILASGNDVLAQMYQPLVPDMAEFRRRTLSLAGSAERSSHDHRAIIEAVRRRQPQDARRVVVQHLWTLYEEVRAAAGAEVETHKTALDAIDVFA